MSSIQFTLERTAGAVLSNVFELNTFILRDTTSGVRYDLTANVVGNNIVLSNTDYITINSNSKFVVTADTKKNITNLDTYKFRLSLNSSNLVLKELIDDTQVTDITPSNLTWRNIDGVVSSLAINSVNQAARTVVV